MMGLRMRGEKGVGLGLLGRVEWREGRCDAWESGMVGVEG